MLVRLGISHAKKLSAQLNSFQFPGKVPVPFLGWDQADAGRPHFTRHVTRVDINMVASLLLPAMPRAPSSVLAPSRYTYI